MSKKAWAGKHGPGSHLIRTPLLSLCRLLRVWAAGLCSCAGLEAGRADEHLLRRTQRLPPQIDALWGLLESKILNLILDQSSHALLCGWRFTALSPNLSLSADASNCKNSFHRDTDLNRNNCVRLGIFFCGYSFSIWKAHQYHQVGVHGLTIWRETISIFSRWSLGLLYLITNRRLHVSFIALKTSWCCEAAGNEIDMAGRGQVFQKPHNLLFFPQTSIFLRTKISSCVLSNDFFFFFKKSKKNRKWRRLHGETSKGMSWVPWRQQKVIFTHVCDFYLYTFSTLFLHIYRLWGGGKNHLHQHLRLTPGAKQWYFIPYHSEGHYLSTTSVPSSSRDLTYTHSHTRECNYMTERTHHPFPSSVYRG